MTTGASVAQAPSWRGTLVGAAVAIVAILAVYGPGMRAGFVGDDFMILHRLRALARPADVLRFFNGEFFEYYRPLGFVAHAIDYASAGADPRRFHLTNLLLHAASAVLVLCVGQRLSPRSLAGPVAALLFALHPSNHEAVMWISARFDLLATTCALAALAWWVRHDDRRLPAAILFFLALLSKESAVALPIAAAGWMVFGRGAGRAAVVRSLVPWIAALALYSVMRQLGGGVSGIGGASRLPKLLAFGAVLGAVVLLAGDRWQSLRERLLRARTAAATVMAVTLAVAAGAAALSNGSVGRLAEDKLAVAGFVLTNLFSPVADFSDRPFYLEPSTGMYWLGGMIAAAVAGAVLIALWRRLVADDRMWFLATLLVATLLPISALTEGKRYLYLPSAALSIIAGVLIAELRGPSRRAAMAAVAVMLTVSAFDISRKVRDWVWAGEMTAGGARMADAALAPRCGDGTVVFLTSPVGLRGVYTHFYYETFELPRGCMPATFQVLARIVRIDSSPDVRWDGPDRIAITADPYSENLALSEDLREFTRPLRAGEKTTIVTPLGQVQTAPVGSSGMRLTLTLSDAAKQGRPLLFYYSGGRIERLVGP